MDILQQVISGLTSGSLYVLLAIGISLVYRTLGVVNFAYGETFMLGAFIGLILYDWLHIPFVLTFILTIIISGFIGILIERVAYRRLYRKHHLILLLTTVGVSVFLRNGATAVFGTVPQAFPAVFGEKPIIIGELIFIPQNLFILSVAVAIMVFLQFFLKSKFGTAMRAAAQSKDAASLMGIDISKTTMATWGISAALGGIAGLLMSPIFFVATTVGTSILIKGFAAAVLGGIGNITGAIVGGLLLGIIENIGAFYISSTWKDGISFAIMLIVLMIRPAGLFGKYIEKI